MITKNISSFYHFYPCTVTLVGARRGDQINFMAAAWNVGISFDPPLFGVSISPKRFTHDMILEAGEFTCNFLSMEEIDVIHGTGKISGRDHDKISAFSIPLEEPVVVDCPTIKSAYAAYECKLVRHYPVGDHSFFVGEVVALHSREDVTTKTGQLNPEKVNFAMYLGNNMYISTDANSVRLMPDEVTVASGKSV